MWVSGAGTRPPSSLSFYRNRLTVMAFPGKREIQFQPPMSYRPWYVPGDEDLRAFLVDQPELFVVARQKTLKLFGETYAYQCEPAFMQRKYSAYLCRSIPGPE